MCLTALFSRATHEHNPLALPVQQCCLTKAGEDAACESLALFAAISSCSTGFLRHMQVNSLDSSHRPGSEPWLQDAIARIKGFGLCWLDVAGTLQQIQ